MLLYNEKTCKHFPCVLKRRFIYFIYNYYTYTVTVSDYVKCLQSTYMVC